MAMHGTDNDSKFTGKSIVIFKTLSYENDEFVNLC